MGLFDKISDDFQHSRGQKDGAHGKLFGTSGDAFTKKYREGFDAGRYDYHKKKYGETLAKAAKAERDFARRISEGGKKSNNPRKEESTNIEEQPHNEVEYCPICGDEYDGVYCYSCDDDYDEEDELAWQEEQRKRAEEAEQKRKKIVEKIQGKNHIELQNILLFGNDEDPDVKIAAINKMDVFSARELKLATLYDDSYRVREVARQRLRRLNLEAPSEDIENRIQNLEKNGINRRHVKFLEVQARFDPDPNLRKYAERKLSEYRTGKPYKAYNLTYGCVRCGHQIKVESQYEKFSPEMQNKRCPIRLCGDPPWWLVLWRQMKGECISGYLELARSEEKTKTSLYILRYKCTRCGHEYYSTSKGKPPETTMCLMGCSNPPRWLALWRLLKGEKVDGFGRLIKSKKL